MLIPFRREGRWIVAGLHALKREPISCVFFHRVEEINKRFSLFQLWLTPCWWRMNKVRPSLIHPSLSYRRVLRFVWGLPGQTPSQRYQREAADSSPDRNCLFWAVGQRWQAARDDEMWGSSLCPDHLEEAGWGRWSLEALYTCSEHVDRAALSNHEPVRVVQLWKTLKALQEWEYPM